MYVAEQFPHVRVECCESCKHFLRTIDLTKDGNAVPIVDDIAAIPLSLWAQENSYSTHSEQSFGNLTRSRSGLAGEGSPGSVEKLAERLRLAGYGPRRCLKMVSERAERTDAFMLVEC